MNILIVSQYFWPEPFIINDLVIKMKEQGHQVSVFTGKPNYPDGALYPGYVSAGVQEEVYNGDIKVYRVPLKPRKTGGAKNLMINYCSFVWSGLKHAKAFSKNKEFDSIIVFAPSPITSAIPALLLKRLTKSHLSIWIQDLWPESLSATGFVRNRFLLNCVRVLVKGIYRFSDTLLVQSQAFIPQVEKLAPAKEIIYCPNSAKDDVYQENQEVNIPEELEQLLTNQFCVVFAGNIGTAQAVETIVAAAEQLTDLTDLKIVMVGSGSQVEWIKQQIADKNLSNLVLAGRFPATHMPFIFSKSKALLVTLKRDEIFTYTVPCKIQAYMAAGKPIIAAIDGEGAKVVDDAQAGFTSASEEADALANNIKKMYHLPHSLREQLGQSGRAYFLKHFEMEHQTQRLIDILGDRINKRKHAK